MRLTRRAVTSGVATVLLSIKAWANDIPSPVPGKRVALRGYDPVAYFTDGHPVQGDPRFWYEFDDTVYLFASADHRAAFVSDPDHYAPVFRGYCAVSIAFGAKDEGLPDVWEIVDGTLFVFGRPSGQADFATDPAGITARAKERWAALQTK